MDQMTIGSFKTSFYKSSKKLLTLVIAGCISYTDLCNWPFCSKKEYKLNTKKYI